MKPAGLLPADSVPRRSFDPWPGRHVWLDGSRTHVRDTPPAEPGAEPALYVHGLGGSAQNWTDLAGLLAHRLAGRAIDLPGFGLSDPGRRYTVGAAAARVARFIEYDMTAPVHLVGNSLGGVVALRVAGCRPELVRSLTLISPAMPFVDVRRSLQSRALPLLVVPRSERIVARLMSRVPPEDMARQVIQACFADPDRLSDQRRAEALEEVLVRYTAAHYPAAYLRTLRGLVLAFLRSYLPGSRSLWRIARSVRAPALVIGGWADRLVDPRVGPRVAAALPDSRLLMLDRVGHVAQMEDPHTVARAVLAFLDEVARTAEPESGPGQGGGAQARVAG